MLTGAAAFLLVVIALLAIPVTLQFHVSFDQALQEDVRLLWAFGLVRARIPLARPRSRSPAKKAHDRKSDRPRESSHKKRNVVAAFRQRKFRRQILRFVGRLWRAVSKQDIDLRIRLGLGDPADTGRLWAVVGPIGGMLAIFRDATISIEPEFFSETFELETSGSVRLIPLQVIGLIVALLLSPPFWQGMRRLRRAGD